MPFVLDAELGRRLQCFPWRSVVDKPVVVAHDAVDLHARDLVAAAAWLRGDWRGVVVVRCDRNLAAEIARGLSSHRATEDRGVLWALEHSARAVIELAKGGAEATDTVTLSGPEAWWFPTSSRIKARAAVTVGTDLLAVEVYERRRRALSSR
jgi:hypothetical protein